MCFQEFTISREREHKRRQSLIVLEEPRDSAPVRRPLAAKMSLALDHATGLIPGLTQRARDKQRHISEQGCIDEEVPAPEAEGGEASETPTT